MSILTDLTSTGIKTTYSGSMFDPTAAGAIPFIPPYAEVRNVTSFISSETGRAAPRTEEAQVTQAPTLADEPSSAVESNTIVVQGNRDDRVRIIPKNMGRVLGQNDPRNNLLSILHETRGVLFPYTPTITVSQSVNWDAIGLVHTNWDVNAYQRTPSVTISINGTFTAQNQREGEYLMAVLHFLRVVTKSDYGLEAAENGTAGLPPPVLELHGYGTNMFKALPVVIKSYNYSLDENTDSTLFYSRNNESARLPAKMQISMELGVQIPMQAQREYFSMESFRSGDITGFY